MGTARGGTRTPGYSAALDGIRALAVLAVLAYHAGADWLPGGFLGVDVFLVLSGYLITHLLLVEWEAHGRLRLGRFWDRRIRRLAPALVLVVVAVLVHAAVAGSVASVRGDAVGTLTWVQNWHLALSDASYFAVFGEASPLRHAWSLALEAQWYLIWPPVLWGLLRLGRGRTLPIALVASGLATASALLMAVQFSAAADPSRIYYGTDTRGHVLLIGAAVALVLHGRAPVRGRAAWWGAGLVGVVGVALAMVRLGDLDPALYRGGFALAGMGTALVIVAALDARSPVARALAVEPLPALGRISYGVYLWHWPLYLWLEPSLAVALLSIAVAAGSYALIETPVRRAPSGRRRVTRFGTVAVTGAAVVAALTVPDLSTPAPVAAKNPGLANPVVDERPRADDQDDEAPPEAVGPLVDRPVSRVLLAGDSVALTLGEHFQPDWVGGAFGLDYSATFLGCGVVAGQPLNEGRPVLWSDETCLQWKERWRRAIATVRPDVVVVLLGAWEVMDRRFDGTVFRVGTAAYEAYLSEQLDAGFDLLADAGVAGVVLTAPCYRPRGEPPGRSTSDRGDDERVQWFNDVLRSTAEQHPHGAAVADLNGFMCPDGRQVTERDGRPQLTDGVHFTPQGARSVWEWLGPQLSPGGTT